MESKLQTSFVFLFSFYASLVGAQGLGMAPEQAAGLAQDRLQAGMRSELEQEQLQAATQTHQHTPHFGEQYGPVQNETLWRISMKLVKNSGFSIQQGIEAITAKNQHAFRNGRMKKDVVLNLPTQEEMKINAGLMDSAKAEQTETMSPAED